MMVHTRDAGFLMDPVHTSSIWALDMSSPSTTLASLITTYFDSSRY